MNEWYRKSIEDVFVSLKTGLSGLTPEEAGRRLAQYGYNELKFKKRSAILRFLAQFRDPLVYILLITSLVTALLKEVPDTVIILLCVFVNTIIGFIQEGKAESSIEALKKMMVLECAVLRGGEKRTIPARELVPGDIVVLESGNKVPADLRLFSAKNFSVDESLLTGESVPVHKDTIPIDKKNLSLADQRCMVFSGTFVSKGSGQGIVVATGESTEFGKISKFMKETAKITTPLMRKIAEFTRFLVVVIAIIGAVNFVLALFHKYTVGYAFLASVSLVVAAIPEMLPAVIVAILSLASVAMARRKALIRRLPAAETLGCVTVICSDKTGTITKNEMTVTKIFSGKKLYSITGTGYGAEGLFLDQDVKLDIFGEPKELIETLRAGFFCNNVTLASDKGVSMVGDPTEKALVVSALKAGITIKADMLDEIPFESEHQYMATLHESENGNIIYVKGAPEKILSFCKDRIIDGKFQPLDKEDVLSAGTRMAGEALRVLGMAFKHVSREKRILLPEDIQGFTFLGLQGMIDPPREEAVEAIAKCAKSGIRVIMMTGDHAQTARAIAEKAGIVKKGGRVVTGEEMSGMAEDEFSRVVQDVSVFARIAPEHKLRITQHLQRAGHVVAVTGDGVNDAPALKAADIGVAMGITGTEVSKEAADMVLADDNFATIIAAVEEGRHAWKNFQKAVLYTLPTNGGQAFLIIGAILAIPFLRLFSVRLPLEPIHILWINLADSIFLTIPLMMEPKEKDLLESPPRDIKEKIANKLFLFRVGSVSVLMAATGFFLYYFFGAPAYSGEAPDLHRIMQAQTASFVGVQLLMLGYLFTARSIYASAFTLNPLTNRWLLLGVGLTVFAILVIVYVPFGNAMFRTAAFPASWWPMIFLALFPGFVVTEIEKYLERRKAIG